MSEWVVESDGIRHNISVKKGLRKKIIVDNEVIKVKSSSSIINLVDHLIDFGEKKCHLVMLGGKVDLAVDGVYLNSKKPYEPLSGIPKFVMVLVGISSIGGFIWNGIIGLCIGLIFASLYLQNGVEKKNNKVVISFAVCTVIQLVIGLAIMNMLSH